MFNAMKFNDPGRRPAFLFRVFLFAAVLALMPISAAAQCSTGWDASGRHGIRQRGMRYGFTVELQQKGRVITGNAHGTVDNSDGGVDTLKGTVDGTLDGDSFSVQIFWTNGSTGVYNAKVLPSGRLDGEGYEKNSPNVRVPWNSTGVLMCPPPPVIPKVIKSSGKARPAPPASQPKPPFVVASQVIKPSPFHPTGFVILTWDAGPDHPNAEVVVKINNSPDIPVLKQAKGSLQLPVERGRSYAYLLTDAGKTLSTVGFVVQ
jgi:hypothetical protein